MQATKMSRVVRAAVVSVAALAMAAGVGSVAAAQRSGGGGTSTVPSATGAPAALPNVDSPAAGLDPSVRARMEQERINAVNDDRHKRLAADVDRLIELTNSLKTDVDKAGKDELSVDVIKKAQEIEKLAHDVQSRMKN